MHRNDTHNSNEYDCFFKGASFIYKKIVLNNVT